jgi:predicted HNH restriction endonuclease
MSSSRKISVGEVVRYPDPPDQTAEQLDGYRNFFNLTRVPGAARLIMNRGIDNPALVAAPEGQRRPVILIRTNPLQAGTAKTPWRDVLDLAGGRLTYYGDHKADSPGPPESTRGNAALLAAFETHHAEDQESRASAVPLLVFRTVERNNQSKGYLEFCGLGIIEHVMPVDQQDLDTGRSFLNYRYDIALLDLTPEGDKLDWRWVNARRESGVTLEEANDIAPASWRSWIKTGNTEPVESGRRSETGTSSTGGTAASVRSPDWTRDELILTCALVYRNSWHEVKRNDERALELSELLRALPIHPHKTRAESFRNPNSVQRKTADLATAHPDYKGIRTKGGQLSEQVVNEFMTRPHEMLSAADRIVAALDSSDPDLLRAIATPDTQEDDVTAVEGRVLERVHRFHERKPRLRREKIRSVLRAGGTLACQVCSFDFAERFGAHGEGYIEVHHVVPLHVTGASETKLTDLVLVCANCHRMSHRRLERTKTWPSPAELRALMGTYPPR